MRRIVVIGAMLIAKLSYRLKLLVKSKSLGRLDITLRRSKRLRAV